MARRVFPSAELHAIEPQPACRAALEALRGRVHLHLVAVTRPGITEVRMEGAGTTGAWIVNAGSDAAGSLSVPASSLDALIGERLSTARRPLLKLDLEGHEMAALEGAPTALSSVEVIISEVHFFEIYNNGLPVFGDLVRFLEGRGFHLYDIAALGSRPSDGRLRTGDVVFVRRGSALLGDARPD
jgi:FkbM family methyltransferase